MFCRHCGTENADEANFCKSCGKPLKDVEVKDPVDCMIQMLSGIVSNNFLNLIATTCQVCKRQPARIILT